MRVLVVSAIAVAFLVPVQAQQRTRPYTQTEFQRWVDEEVALIISDNERASLHELVTDGERGQYVELYWRRRDPTPGTEVNEFREEHYRRLQWATYRLGGWKADRGMAYVKFGAPDAREEHAADATDYHYEKWTYKFLEGVGRDVVLQFVDPGNTNEFRLNPAREVR